MKGRMRRLNNILKCVLDSWLFRSVVHIFIDLELFCIVELILTFAITSTIIFVKQKKCDMPNFNTW